MTIISPSRSKTPLLLQLLISFKRAVGRKSTIFLFIFPNYTFLFFMLILLQSKNPLVPQLVFEKIALFCHQFFVTNFLSPIFCHQIFLSPIFLDVFFDVEFDKKNRFKFWPRFDLEISIFLILARFSNPIFSRLGHFWKKRIRALNSS